MSLINIVKTDDPNFRYKMPRISTKIEGRGNGIKTVITNMSEVAQALHRHPKYTTKFFGCELGAQTKYDDETDRSVVNGAHDNRTIQDLLFKFIELFVLCPNCNLPETALKARRGVIYHKCNACGEKSSVDMSHKLCTLILRVRFLFLSLFLFLFFSLLFVVSNFIGRRKRQREKEKET